MLIRKIWVCLALIAVCAVSPSAAQETAGGEAAKPSGVPQIIVVVDRTSNDLQVTDIKMRGFYNKFEEKFIPLSDFDFAANLTAELLNAFLEDKRATWRGPKPEEGATFAEYFGPNSWKQQTIPPSSVEADRVLLVGAIYSKFFGLTSNTFLHVVGHDLSIGVDLRMADRKSGRILWKKGLGEKMRLPGKLEELQADNQKGLKEALNKLVEQIVPKIKQYVARSQI